MGGVIATTSTNGPHTLLFVSIEARQAVHTSGRSAYHAVRDLAILPKVLFQVVLCQLSLQRAQQESGEIRCSHWQISQLSLRACILGLSAQSGSCDACVEIFKSPSWKPVRSLRSHHPDLSSIVKHSWMHKSPHKCVGCTSEFDNVMHPFFICLLVDLNTLSWSRDTCQVETQAQ